MSPIVQTMIVGAAGFVGAIARFGAATLAARLGVGFPYGTMAINVAGSFAAGALYGWGAGRGDLPEHLRLAIGVGFLGAFTTFSTFTAETDALLRAGMMWRAAAYVGLSLVVGLLAARGGYVLMGR
jgi:CrcB protein